MRTAGESTGVRIVKDAFWLAIGLLFLSGLVRMVISLLSKGFAGIGAMGLLWLGISALATYWIGAGAIRRTSWAQRRHRREEQSLMEEHDPNGSSSSA